MKKVNLGKEGLRIAVFGSLLAILFGIVTYTSAKFYGEVSREAFFRVFSLSSFDIAIPFFIFFLVFLGISLCYNKKESKKIIFLKELSYDLGMALVCVIFFVLFSIFILIRLVGEFPGFIGYSKIYMVLTFVIGAFILFRFLLKYFKKFISYLKKNSFK